MDSADLPRLLYLGLLLLVIGGGLLLTLRGRASTALSHAALWALIFLGVIAAAALWPEIRAAVAPGQRAFAAEAGPAVEVPRARDGHYYLELDVGGTPVLFTVDTGATDIVLSRGDAEAVGIDPEALSYLGTAFTANGTVRTARVTLPEMRLGGLVDREVGAVVTDGDLGFSLLGMAYLSRFARIEIEGGRLVLTR